MYYDFFMKSEFLENQILVNQERKKKAIKRSLSNRRTGTIADDIKQFQKISQIKHHEQANKNQEEEEQEKKQDDYGFKVINELKEGNYFGEISMITNLRRTCSVYTVSNGFFAVIEKDAFMTLANSNTDLKHKLINKINQYNDDNIKFQITMLKNVPVFRPLENNNLRLLCHKLRDERF